MKYKTHICALKKQKLYTDFTNKIWLWVDFTAIRKAQIAQEDELRPVDIGFAARDQ